VNVAYDIWRSGLITKRNNAIVDYTSPALCTPITPFPPIGDAAYRHEDRATDRQHAQKIGKDRACSSGDILADRQTDTQTDIFITILRNRSRGRNNELAQVRSYKLLDPMLQDDAAR